MQAQKNRCQNEASVFLLFIQPDQFVDVVVGTTPASVVLEEVFFAPSVAQQDFSAPVRLAVFTVAFAPQEAGAASAVCLAVAGHVPPDSAAA